MIKKFYCPECGEVHDADTWDEATAIGCMLVAERFTDIFHDEEFTFIEDAWKDWIDDGDSYSWHKCPSCGAESDIDELYEVIEEKR